ncbi:hypothetical protein QUF80_13640 [Desulfococcaceae bacterium HSG8]|nr:hypothetical protein [Desulfococcaceae bacterium HSG8]
MNRITLRQDGSVVHNGKTVESDPLMFLSAETDLGEGYTLRSYFRMFEKYEVLSHLNAFFSTYMEQYRSSPENNCVYDGFEYLEFGKTVEMIGFPGRPRLEIYCSLYGVYGNDTSDLRSVQLENILDMPLKLGRLKHIVFGDKVDIFEFDTVFTLFEFIDSMLWELSFHGTLMACSLRI